MLIDAGTSAGTRAEKLPPCSSENSIGGSSSVWLNQGRERVANPGLLGTADVQAIHALLPFQEQMLRINLERGSRDPNVLRFLIEFGSRLRFEHFMAALNRLVMRHQALRSAFFPRRRLSDGMRVVYRHAALQALPCALDEAQDTEAQLRSYLDQTPLHVPLDQAPLLSIRFAQAHHERRCYALLVTHRIIMDVDSWNEMLEEIEELRTAFLVSASGEK